MLMHMTLESLLREVAAGRLGVPEALGKAKHSGVHDLGFARLDLDRPRRCGMAEAVYCAGKTPEQVVRIVAAMRAAGQNVLGTRATRELYKAVRRVHPDVVYHEAARAITLDVRPLPPPVGCVAVVTAGTADVPVAEEAALTAERLGARVERIFDVGVAGLHRVVAHLDVLRSARVVVAVAGMEGALPSVLGGLVGRPIIAVPTSVGYGTNFQGLTPLLAMLNSCAPGVAVVNVDNGFGAGVMAAMINRIGEMEPAGAAGQPVRMGPRRPRRGSSRHRGKP